MGVRGGRFPISDRFLGSCVWLGFISRLNTNFRLQVARTCLTYLRNESARHSVLRFFVNIYNVFFARWLCLGGQRHEGLHRKDRERVEV